MQKKILAIDYGRVRIGLAVSYDTFAEPLKILPHTDQIIQDLQQVIAEEQIEMIVVGISDQQMAEETKQFVASLQKVIDLPFDFIDESYSSKTVQRKMIEAGTKQSKRRQPIDHFAAAEFLQEYLDTLGQGNR